MARAIGAIASEGHLVRPHMIAFDNLPAEVQGHYKEIVAKYPDEQTVPIDPKNWEIITDALQKVVSPVGTAALSQIKGIDFGGKTGSAQTVSNAFKERMGKGGGDQFKDNGWFVGVSPTRNPDIVVAVLYQSGEHGDRTAPIAAQVIKAFVEKQRKVLNNYAYATPPGYTAPAPKPTVSKPAADQQVPPTAPSAPAVGESPAAKFETKHVQMAGVWSQPDEDGHQEMGGGKFAVTPDAKPRQRVTAAPGMDMR
jgi:penicillin-binding protein 2